MSLPRLSIRRPVAVAMFFVAVIFLGLISFSRLPIDLLPDVAYPRLVIYTQYASVGPAEIERLVTTPIEQVVSTVPGKRDIESVSREGVSLVTLRFAWGTDMDFAVLNVREKLDNVRSRLPETADAPIVLRTDPRSEPVMAVSLAGGRDLVALKELAETVFKRRLEQIDGVAEAAVTGGLEREIHVEVDPRRLESLGLTIEEIADALDAANETLPGGTVRRGRYRYALRTLGEFESVDQIGDVVVGRRGGEDDAADQAPARLITLRDVATIEDGFEERESIARFNGREAVGLLLFKEPAANTVRVAERVGEVLEQLGSEYASVRSSIAMSQAGFIGDAISNVVQALVLGGILAFLVLFLFLRDARYPVAVALAIPISVVSTFALMDAFGVSLNIMSLGGLALGVGMLVDNSIVVLENIFRHSEPGATAGAGSAHADASSSDRARVRGGEPDSAEEARRGEIAAGRAARGGARPDRSAAAVGAEEVQGAITASTLTTVSVFGPIVYVEGVAGELFGALSLAVTFSLVASLLVALTLLPMLAGRWIAGGSAVSGGSRLRRAARRLGGAVSAVSSGVFGRPLRAFDRGFARFAERYHGWLEAALANRGSVVAATVLLLAGAVALGSTLDRAVLPDVDQGAFRARLEMPKGSPLERTATLAERLEAAFLEDPGIEAVFSRIGRQVVVAGLEEDETGLHTAVLDVRLAPGHATRDVLARLGPVLATVPAGVLALETGQATALGQLLGGGEADIAVRVRGDDVDAALRHAQRVERALAAVASLDNIRLGTELGQPEVRVEIDRERVAAYGLEPRRVAQTVEDYMRGKEATEFVDFDRKIPIVVRLPEADRRSLATLEELRVDGVPLRELVRTTEALGPSEVHRLEQSRVVPVYADVGAGALAEAIEEIRAELSGLPTPAGLRVEIGGENEEMRRSFRDLGFAFGLALLLVYMILAAQFESLIHPFTILLSVPLAIVGAVLALWLAGAGLNTMSLIGLVILVGIVVNDAIVKVDFINQARARGAAVRAAILEAGRARLRPIIMTTVTTVLGLTPLALGIGRGADLRAPLAIAVIGGLITATALTLILVPVAYDLVDSAGARLMGRTRGPNGGADPQDAGAARDGEPRESGAPAAAGVVPGGEER